MLAAGDTFRAAAIEQLKIWGERTRCPVIAGAQGADAAGLVYEALAAARAQAIDVLIVDTAGRLQNKAGLMDELRQDRPRREEARPGGAPCGAARARRHRGAECAVAGRGILARSPASPGWS